MRKFLPKKCFLTAGVGTHKDKLISFELALRAAGIERFNLVPVSSILPPNCKIVDKEEALRELEDGEIVFVVMARNESNENGKIACAVAYARPQDKDRHGYIAEYSCRGCGKEMAEQEALRIAREMLKTKFGDVEDIKTESVGASAKTEKGVYTTVVSAAVFVI